MDEIISIAQNTEFIYHEMTVTLACIRHGGPRSVLIIGGGDGGAAKHALAVKTVQRVLQIEIDKDVVNASKKFLPAISNGSFDDDRLELIIGDGMDFVKKTSEKFDIVVLDVTEPIPGGPAEDFLSKGFLGDVKRIMNDDGVFVTHCGTLIFQANKISQVMGALKEVFTNVDLHTAMVPEFEFTDSGFLVCSSWEKPTQAEIVTRFKHLLTQECKFLSPEIYFSSSVISPFVRKLTGMTSES